MVEKYNCLEDVKERFNNCHQFYYNKRILKDPETGKYFFVVDNSTPVGVMYDELIMEEVAK